jgi:glycine/D-amino acid oxidase-like deaminating enzyme
LLQIGPENGVVIDGVLTSAAKHGLQVQKLSATESLYRFPQYAVPEDCVAAYEADAGFLRVEDCVLEHLRLAQQMGAELHTGVVARDWHATAAGVELETSEGSFHAGALVITAGAWAPSLLASLGILMKVLRKPLFWLQSSSSAHLQQAGCPCFFYELPEGQFYGFPELTTGCGVKMACHTGGDVVADPAAVDRKLNPHDLALVQSFAASCLPQVSGAMVKEATCLYTMSPDEHFIVDHHPGHANVVFAAGLSGHGFKLASVLGEILADLALEQRTDLPAEFLSLSRFGVK